jgi:hypothetical protein
VRRCIQVQQSIRPNITDEEINQEQTRAH